MKSHRFLAFVLANYASIASASSERPLPRGVGPDFAKFYQDAESFSCIFNPSIKLSLEQINDDYCDCPDGSDEPGTSACSHLSELSPPSINNADPTLNYTPALPGFYCHNKGHVPGYIPFTYVNDGICDTELCCDGSDESEGTKCDNKCKEIGAEYKKQSEVKAKARAAALKQRDALVVEAKRVRQEIIDKIKNMKTLLTSDEINIANAEKELVEVEKQEKLRVVKAPKQGGRLGMLVSLSQNRIEDLKSSLRSMAERRDSAETRVKTLEDILDKFKEEYNPNFNDEGVKRAVRAWEDYAGSGKLPLADVHFDNEVDARLRDDSENGIQWEEFEEEDSEGSLLYNLEDYLPQSIREWVIVKVADFRELLIENGLLAAKDTESVGESKAVQDARSRVDTVKSERDNRQREITDSEEDLNKNYGPEEIFRALKDQCFEAESGEYNYEHCFMAATTQKSRNGGMNTNMGNFDRIEMIMVDEEEPADGKGLGSGERIALKYENGAHCWNGPARSTMVILACSEKNEIWKVIEAEKCVYRIEAGSPAACMPDGPKPERSGNVKDEL